MSDSWCWWLLTKTNTNTRYSRSFCWGQVGRLPDGTLRTSEAAGQQGTEFCFLVVKGLHHTKLVHSRWWQWLVWVGVENIYSNIWCFENSRTRQLSVENRKVLKFPGELVMLCQVPEALSTQAIVAEVLKDMWLLMEAIHKKHQGALENDAQVLVQKRQIPQGKASQLPRDSALSSDWVSALRRELRAWWL